MYSYSEDYLTGRAALSNIIGRLYLACIATGDFCSLPNYSSEFLSYGLRYWIYYIKISSFQQFHAQFAINLVNVHS